MKTRSTTRCYARDKTRHDQPRARKEVLLFGVASTPRAWEVPRWQSQGICIAFLASQEDERLQKSLGSFNHVSSRTGEPLTLEKRRLLIYNHTDT